MTQKTNPGPFPFRTLVHLPYPMIMAAGSRKRDRWHIYKKSKPPSGYVDWGTSLCGDHDLCGLREKYKWGNVFVLRSESDHLYCQACLKAAYPDAAYTDKPAPAQT